MWHNDLTFSPPTQSPFKLSSLYRIESANGKWQYLGPANPLPYYIKSANGKWQHLGPANPLPYYIESATGEWQHLGLAIPLLIH